MRFRGVRYEPTLGDSGPVVDAKLPDYLNLAVARGIEMAEREYQLKVFEYPYRTVDPFVAVVLRRGWDGSRGDGVIERKQFAGASLDGARLAAVEWIETEVATALHDRSTLVHEETIDRTC